VESLKKTISEKTTAGAGELVLLHEQDKDEWHQVLDVTKKQADEARLKLEKLNEQYLQLDLELAKEKDERDRLVQFVREILGTLPDANVTTSELFDMDATRLMEKFKLAIHVLTRRGYGTGQAMTEGYEQHIHELKSRVVELQSENLKLREEIESLKSTIDQLRVSLVQLETEHKLNQSRLSSPDAGLDVRTIEQYETMLRHLKDQLADSDNRLKSMAELVESSDRKNRAFLDAKEERIRELEEEMGKLKKHRRTSSSEGTGSKKLPDVNSSKHRTSSPDTNRRLDAVEMERLRVNELQTHVQVDVLMSKVRDYENALQHAEKTISALQKEAQERTSSVQRLMNEKEVLQQQLDKHRHHAPFTDESDPSPSYAEVRNVFIIPFCLDWKEIWTRFCKRRQIPCASWMTLGELLPHVQPRLPLHLHR